MTDIDATTVWRITGIHSSCTHRRTKDWTVWVSAKGTTEWDIRRLDLRLLDASTVLALPKLIAAFGLTDGLHRQPDGEDLLDAASGLFGNTVRGIGDGDRVRFISPS